MGSHRKQREMNVMNYEMYNFIRTATADELADIALKMIAKHPDTFEEMFNAVVDTGIWIPKMVSIKEPISGTTYNFSEKEIELFKKLGPITNKVPVIKEVRSIYKIGLKEAKDLVECQSFLDATR
jgi:ribosomal protein L7/L12